MNAPLHFAEFFGYNRNTFSLSVHNNLTISSTLSLSLSLSHLLSPNTIPITFLSRNDFKVGGEGEGEEFESADL